MLKTNKILATIFLVSLFASVGWAQGNPPLVVQEADGSPKRTGISIIEVSNGTLTISGRKATITTGGGGTGTVTSVSVTTANGVSGSVATATTTPAITLTLGAITPTSVNKVTFTAPATAATLTLIDGTTITGPSATTTLPGLSLGNLFTTGQAIQPATDVVGLTLRAYSSGTNYIQQNQTSASVILSGFAHAGEVFFTDGAGGAADAFISRVDASATVGIGTTAGGTNGVLAVGIVNLVTGIQIGGAAASRKMLVGNGTNFVASTETWAVPGTSGNVLTSDGTNWTSAAPAGGGLTVGTTAIASGAAGRILYETSGNVLGEIAGSSVDADGAVQLAASARTSGVAQYFRVNTPADTTLTASTESVGVYIGGNGSGSTVTREWSTGALTTQREYVFVAPTYAFAGASTLATAATVAITGPPGEGANAAITTPLALWVQQGQALFNRDNIATTVTDGVLVLNNEEGTAGTANQYSPALVLGGNYWNTNVGPPASEKARVRQYLATSAGNLTQSLNYDFTSENGAYVTAFSMKYRLNVDALFSSELSTARFRLRYNGLNFDMWRPDGQTAAIGIDNTNAIYFSNTDQGLGINKASSVGAQLHVVSGSASRVGLRVDSAATPSVDIVSFTNNASQRWGLNSSTTSTNATVTDVNGGTQVRGTLTESITLNTGGTTTDSTIDLPSNSIILSVTARVTTTITTATAWRVGDPTVDDRFTSDNSTLTAGTTDVGINQWKADRTTAGQGPYQASTAKVRVTTTGTPGAGVVRITIHYITLTAPTS